MRYLITFVCYWFLVSCPTVVRSARSEDIAFNERIRPILNQHCVACHGGVKQAADLSFVYGDDASYVLEPGDPDSSYIIERVTSQDAEERMPPPDHGPGLSDEEILDLRKWIEQGGQWGKHWAFVPPDKIQPPAETENQAWSRSRIDRFVLQTMRQAELEPAPEASPERWLRRVTLDLTGLPPTLEQRDEFLRAVEAAGEAAYAAAVDRLLDDPAFGERWASVWLDLVRYADSKGLGLDARRTIWKYRDWVIRAFNADMPFDEFTVKQIAGDLLPNPTLDDLVATAYNRLTQTCEEGGTDDEMFRVEAVIDRVNTTMTAWQGLTYGCVQCHSHPYDAIQHDEYYELLAFFNNTADCDLGSEEPRIRVPLDESQSQEAHEIALESRAIQRSLWEEASRILDSEVSWKPLTYFSASTNNSTRVVTEPVDGAWEYQTRGTVAKQTTVVVEAPLPGDLKSISALRFTGLPKNEAQALKDSEWGFVISHIQLELQVPNQEKTIALKIQDVIADEPDPVLDPMQSLNSKSQHGFGAYSRIHYPRTAVFVLDESVSIPSGAQLRISLRQDMFETGAFPLVAHRGRFAVTPGSSILQWEQSEEVERERSKLVELNNRLKQIDSVAIPILRERRSEFARPTYVFDRGNYLTKTDAVQASTPELLAGPQAGEEQPLTRLDFARWLASSENPLTARVAVNRFWAQLFGAGLVKTQEDFGSSGERPTHPDLLDDLAARFCGDMGWSVKTLLRELVLSSTYRQTAIVSPEKLKADPENRLLARGPRNRLPAETIRDQALAISGLLSDKRFGPPVHPPIPDGIWLPFQGGDRWDTPDMQDPDRYRRTVYTYIKRSIQFPVLASFDAPTREFCSPRRLPSNTPLQALMTLNDATFVEASHALAQRMQARSEQPAEQLRYGFLLSTCREPSAAEHEALIKLYDTQQTSFGTDTTVTDETKAEKASANANRTEPSEALISVATVLLNLDEVLNK